MKKQFILFVMSIAICSSTILSADRSYVPFTKETFKQAINDLNTQYNNRQISLKEREKRECSLFLQDYEYQLHNPEMKNEDLADYYSDFIWGNLANDLASIFYGCLSDVLLNNRFSIRGDLLTSEDKARIKKDMEEIGEEWNL